MKYIIPVGIAGACAIAWFANADTPGKRMPVEASQAIKREMFREQRLPGKMSDYQLDHIIPCCLDGCDNSRANLQMQPLAMAAIKDELEKFTCKQLRYGVISKQTAKARFKRDN